jgi:maleylpyruvate isomerase
MNGGEVDPVLAQQWAARGTALFLGLLGGLADTELDQPTLLPGWSRRRLIAHLAGNAEGLGRLVTWASTCEVTPMYASAEDRIATIDRGSRLPAAYLRAWVQRTAGELESGLRSLSPCQLTAKVTTSQGREIAASQLAWLRAREVNVHAVDLDAGLAFGDLERAFARTLITDVLRLRGSRGADPALDLRATDSVDTWQMDGSGPTTLVSAPLARLAGWLTGRENRTDLPSLSAWL